MELDFLPVPDKENWVFNGIYIIMKNEDGRHPTQKQKDELIKILNDYCLRDNIHDHLDRFEDYKKLECGCKIDRVQREIVTVCDIHGNWKIK